MPFEVSRRDDVLHLTLDTPGSRANIFNRDTARQTLELMATVDPRDTRAIVFRTAKPDSFINGVGLMLANAARSHDDVVRVSAELREAFLAVRRSPVPTIAAIEGTCWGCGVEFVLNCRHRIAADSYLTHFYMTELNDYLFVPLFGATQNLPSAVGFEDAIELLLWGQRWDAKRAAERGLVNEVARVDQFDAAVGRFVERVLAGNVESCLAKPRIAWRPEDEAILARAQARIAELPPAYHTVYTDALELVTRASRSAVGDEHQELEIEKCADSSLADVGKAAFAFFYIRQTAAELSRSGARRSVERIGFEMPDAELEAFREELRERSPRDVVFDAVAQPGDDIVFRPMNSAVAPGTVATCFTFTAGPGEHDLVLYRPIASRFVELVERERGSGCAVAGYLRRAGYEVSLSRAGGTFGVNRLLRATLAPVIRDLEATDPASITSTLRELGFVRPLADLLRDIDRQALAEILGPMDVRALSRLERSSRSHGALRPALIHALTISWLGAALDNLELGGFYHPSFIDLAAREVLDFPLRHVSLCRYLTPARVREAIAAGSSIAQLVDDGDLHRAEAFLASGARFYR